MTRRRILLAGWLLVLGLSAILPLSAIFHGIVHVGGTVVVRSTLDQPIIAIGSTVVLERGTRSTVVGVLSDIRVHGTATEDLVAIRGRIYLDRDARVEHDALSVLGATYRAPGAVVHGRLGGAVHAWDGRSTPPQRDWLAALTANAKLGLAAGLALLLIGICLTVVFPWQIVLISSTLRTSPIKSAGAGVVSLITFIFLVVPLALSLVGLPFALLLTGAAMLAWLFGITACAVVVGRLVARGPVSLLWATAAGLVAIALSMAVPVAGPLAITFVGLTGAGALAVAMLTRSRPATPLP